MAVSQDRISVYSLADLKNTSDDAIPNYLNSLGFTQSHRLSDTRLALGYSAFAVCALTFLWDYKLGFEATKHYTAGAVGLYMLINGALTWWIWQVEGGIVYIGTNKAGDRLEISTSTTKHVPVYRITATTHLKSDRTRPSTVILRKSFSQWFDAAGRFVAQPFQEMFATGVPVIGKADPKRVVAKKKHAPVEDAPKMDDQWTSLLADSSAMDMLNAAASSTGMESKSAKKRAKKA